ncbi:hypothetical protein HPB51_025771 [Rhipicephalus microplus]|uniref:E3 ubiquitin ligase UBR4 C-terminal domain-containing protein n=1 Tax=Rhipicephalus microplus TaxID=6941 RepID=A0A9J6EKD3_RHIMP|nr:hypothetical protein HPB51_025771 [Rhipicephalus microplus]
MRRCSRVTCEGRVVCDGRITVDVVGAAMLERGGTDTEPRMSPGLRRLHVRKIQVRRTHMAKMDVLINHFKRQLNFIRFDGEHTPEDDVQLECFCNLSAGIEPNDNGNRLKDLLVARGIVEGAIQYLLVYAPPAKSSLLSASENWKEFTSKPALKYVLRILTGLSRGHEKTQVLVSTECIPIIHRLEQVSSDEHVGSLAENLMEALKENPNVAQKIEEVRKQTRDEKKRLAMAMREKQLGELGMRTNEKGQVTAKSSILKQMEDLGEEAGLVCIICREGYKFQPSKILGIYTFSKRCNLDEYEAKPRKTPGYTTVTHFNIVHVDCHMAAVRTRCVAREEKNLANFLEMSPDRQIENCYEGAPPHQPSPPLRPAQSEPSAVAPAPKAAVAQATPPTPEQRPETPESSGLKASPHQARPKIRTNSPHVRASSASEEAMDTSAPLVPKERRGSLERAKKTKKQITGPGDGPVK